MENFVEFTRTFSRQSHCILINLKHFYIVNCLYIFPSLNSNQFLFIFYDHLEYYTIEPSVACLGLNFQGGSRKFLTSIKINENMPLYTKYVGIIPEIFF